MLKYQIYFGMHHIGASFFILRLLYTLVYMWYNSLISRLNAERRGGKMYISSVVSKRTANALLKKNIYTTDDFVRFFPKKYYDLTTLYDIQSAPHDIVCAIRGRLISVRMKGEYGKKYIQGEMIDEKTETPFSFY